MTAARQELGRSAEALASERLERTGARVILRNARATEVRGEIDLIALDRGVLVFVEVKARRTGSLAGPERPALAVTPRKRAKLRSLALAWLRDNDGRVPPHRALRFDVIGIHVDRAGRLVEWEHIRGAF
jgi:putative endonuclease